MTLQIPLFLQGALLHGVTIKIEKKFMIIKST